MWLLDVETFQLKFFAAQPPGYAILSHTWGDDEVIFQDLRDIEHAKQKLGWKKIAYTCEEAIRRGLRYAWVDTCCIDKSSSAELSEAINSMYAWYKDAQCCFVYLSDVDTPHDWAPGGKSIVENIKSSRWFTRGWTLQELIAPSTNDFFDHSWKFVGTKESLRDLLGEITGIEPGILGLTSRVSGVPVGRRMSWAARRVTTRKEDIAYCLLGIFNVNMPLLYGEGDKAFMRLQQEIAAQNKDPTLFAWLQAGPIPRYRGLLAQHPAEFENCSRLAYAHNAFFTAGNFAVTDTGYNVVAHADDAAKKSTTDLESARRLVVRLPGCIISDSKEPASETPRLLRGIQLQRLGGIFVRSEPNTFPIVKTEMSLMQTSRRVRVAPELPDTHSDFMETTSQRCFLIGYDAAIIQKRASAEQFFSSSFRSRSDDDGKFEELLKLNNVAIPGVGSVSQYQVEGSAYPIWWETFTIESRSGEKLELLVICGILMAPDAPSEQLLPWCALFCENNPRDRNFVKDLKLFPSHYCSAQQRKQVSDIMFIRYADEHGTFNLERLPQTCIIDELPEGSDYFPHKAQLRTFGRDEGSVFGILVSWV